MTFEEDMSYGRAVLKEHKLTLLTDDDSVTLYRMDYPEGGVSMYVIIGFMAGRIVITGDCHPGQNGVISAGGYGVEWFSQKLYPGYLCEKFLTKRWVTEYAYDIVKAMLNDTDAHINYTAAQLEAMREAISEYDEWGEGPLTNEIEFGNWGINAGIFGIMDVPGYGYDPTDKLWLCAIQEKFAELIAKDKS